MKKWTHVIKLAKLIGPIFLLCLAIGFAEASDEDLYSFIRLFDKIAITVSDRYISTISPEKMINSSIDGMMDELDKYSQYLSDTEYYQLMKQTHGEYIGVGIEIVKHLDTIRVQSINDGSPAFLSDINVGDRIIKIDSTNVINKSTSDCRDLLKGDEDSNIALTLWRPFVSKTIELELVREKIHLDAVTCWCIDKNNNGYIKIDKFSEGTALEVESLISLLRNKGINGLIIDLQNNPGGLLYEAVEVASIFLNEGDKIVETKGRGAVSLRTYEARINGSYNIGPLVIVIDDQTASSAEIVAGAIQDHDRGLIIGTTSFGKGLVQQIMQFSDNSALKLTTAKYYTPSNRCINKDTVNNEILVKRETDKNDLFYTKSGRAVFGGGGIIPDIYIEPLKVPPFLDEIQNCGYISDFVIKYGPKLIIDRDFAVTQKNIDDFFLFLESKNYVYHNPDYNIFVDFVEQNEEWANNRKINSYVDDIKNVLENKSEYEMLTYSSQIGDHLLEEFITIGMGKSKAYEFVKLKNDPELVRASHILTSPHIYGKLLVDN
jgi:carboxyl-terminal processing protease